MIIKKIEIKKFRGFEEVSFELGSLITVIAGLNGTQKTTVLGMLSQPFSLTSDENPLKDERPLSGGNYKSSFNEKFKLSKSFDIPKSHEWTLHTSITDPYTVESIERQKGNGAIRFWKKGSRLKGSGYIQLPVIFLSLKRLIPIGEDLKITDEVPQILSKEDEDFFKDWHKRILISNDDILDTKYLESPDKNTRGINTKIYDWNQNSAGQDNLGKILLAILSFKQLKDKYPDVYKGGILAIDELDATLYPGSQIKLLNALKTFSSRFKIQIIFTTHSLSILDNACELQVQGSLKVETKNQVKVLYLEKRNKKINILENVTFRTIKNRLNVNIERITEIKILAFTEDREGMAFAKALLKSRKSKFKFVDSTFSCSNLIGLASQKIPAFSFPESIIFLDGDVRANKMQMKQIKKMKNIIVLPSMQSPERLLADYMYNLDDNSPLWSNINLDFNKVYCFKDHEYSKIMTDRNIAKNWFNYHLKDWGPNASKVINAWIRENSEMAEEFIKEFITIYNNIAKECGLETLS